MQKGCSLHVFLLQIVSNQNLKSNFKAKILPLPLQQSNQERNIMT